MIRVKICGIRSGGDALIAAAAGADAVGLVFAAGPRRVRIPAARRIAQDLPPWVTPVVLFVNPTVVKVANIVAATGIRTIQLHGEEPPALANRLQRHRLSVIKAFGVRDEKFAAPINAYLRRCRPAGILLDAYDPKRSGGTGKKFNWDWIVRARRTGALKDWPPLILAGGLKPSNVAAAIKTVRPYGLDVSSGVERQPGCKDAGKIRRFCAQTRTNE